MTASTLSQPHYAHEEEDLTPPSASSSVHNAAYLEALLVLRQTEAIQRGNQMSRQAFAIIDREVGAGGRGAENLGSVLWTLEQQQQQQQQSSHENRSPTNALQLPQQQQSPRTSSSSAVVDKTTGSPKKPDPPQTQQHPQSLADELTDQEDDDPNTSSLQESDDDSSDDEDSISQTLRPTPSGDSFSALFTSTSFGNNSSSPLAGASCETKNNSPLPQSPPSPGRRVSFIEQPSIEKDHVSSTSAPELQKEVLRLRETVRTCYRSLVSIAQNADIKIQKLQLQVLFLERRLADEEAITSRLTVSNQSLRRELQTAFDEARQAQNGVKCRKMVNLHQKELSVEKHLNSLLLARNQAMKQNTTLKRMLLETCTECRRKLPLPKGNSNNNNNNNAESSPTAQTGVGGTGQPGPRPSAVVPAMSAHDSVSSFTESNSTLGDSIPRINETEHRPTWQSSTRHVLAKLKQGVAPVPSKVVVGEKSTTSTNQPPRRTLTNYSDESERSMVFEVGSSHTNAVLVERSKTSSTNSNTTMQPHPYHPSSKGSSSNIGAVAAPHQRPVSSYSNSSLTASSSSGGVGMRPASTSLLLHNSKRSSSRKSFSNLSTLPENMTIEVATATTTTTSGTKHNKAPLTTAAVVSKQHQQPADPQRLQPNFREPVGTESPPVTPPRRSSSINNNNNSTGPTSPNKPAVVNPAADGTPDGNHKILVSSSTTTPTKSSSSRPTSSSSGNTPSSSQKARWLKRVLRGKT